MEITLHLGAHRCASTSFQHYLRSQADDLQAEKISFWGPCRTRNGLLNPVYHASGQGWKARKDGRKARGRVRMQVERAASKGIEKLIVSDENMIGTARQCVRTRRLYPAVGERLARLHSAFDHKIDRVVLSIRSHDLWWASAIAFTVSRGYPVPNALSLEEIASSMRGWRDVITDVACALPDTYISVLPFETFAAQPQHVLGITAKTDARLKGDAPWLNRSPDCRSLRALLIEQGVDPEMVPDQHGRWQPFDDAQCANLREKYADDLHWLITGADGIATLKDDPAHRQTGLSLHVGALTEGTRNDDGQERLARSG